VKRYKVYIREKKHHYNMANRKLELKVSYPDFLFRTKEIPAFNLSTKTYLFKYL